MGYADVMEGVEVAGAKVILERVWDVGMNQDCISLESRSDDHIQYDGFGALRVDSVVEWPKDLGIEFV